MILNFNNIEKINNLLTFIISLLLPSFIRNPLYLTKTSKNIYYKNYKIKCTNLFIRSNNWYVCCSPLLFCNLFVLIVCLTNYITISEQSMSDHSYSLSDGYGQDLVSAGAVSSYHWTGDVEDLLAEDLFPETEDMETGDCQGDGEGNSPDEHNVDSLAAPGKGSGQGVSEGLSNSGFEVNDTSVPPKDADMGQVDDLRDAALASRPVKTLASSKGLGAIAKRSKLPRSLSSGSNKDVLVINLSPLPRYQGSCCPILKLHPNTFCLGPLECIIGHFYGKSYHIDIICSIDATTFYFPLIVLLFHGYLTHLSLPRQQRANSIARSNSISSAPPPSHPPMTSPR